MQGGNIDLQGRVSLSPDPRHTLGKTVSYEVVAIHDPKIRVSGTIPIRYDCDYVARFDGKRGRTGRPGRSASGDQPGLPGGAGGPGGKADDIRVSVKVVPGGDKGRLLQVVVTSQSRARAGRILAELDAGSITVSARGGQGGPGGRGGNAQRGKPGDGGKSGDGGEGGAITLVIDPSAEAHYKRVKLDNAGGDPGVPGEGGTNAAGTRGATGAKGRPGKPGPKVILERDVVID